MRQFLVIIVLFAACTSKPKVPKGILSINKMQAITWDLVRADGLVASFATADSATKAKLSRYGLYQQVFEIHHVSKAQYRQSLRFYQNRPDMLAQVFDTLDKKVSKTPFQKTAVGKDTL